MFLKDLKNSREIIAGDNSILKELLNPLNDDIKTGYSLAYACVKPGEITLAHRLKSSEVYFILEGRGEMYIDDEKVEISADQAVYIPPNAVQKIKNIGRGDLTFLCIVDPAWKAEDEEIME